MIAVIAKKMFGFINYCDFNSRIETFSHRSNCSPRLRQRSLGKTLNAQVSLTFY